MMRVLVDYETWQELTVIVLNMHDEAGYILYTWKILLDKNFCQAQLRSSVLQKQLTEKNIFFANAIKVSMQSLTRD